MGDKYTETLQLMDARIGEVWKEQREVLESIAAELEGLRGPLQCRPTDLGLPYNPPPAPSIVEVLEQLRLLRAEVRGQSTGVRSRAMVLGVHTVGLTRAIVTLDVDPTTGDRCSAALGGDGYITFDRIEVDG